MKALIRHDGETVVETDSIEGIDWMTGAPLTNKAWYGGPYTLVQNYVPPKEDAPETYDVIEQDPEPEVEDEDDYVIIDGKRYSKEELRSLLE